MVRRPTQFKVAMSAMVVALAVAACGGSSNQPSGPITVGVILPLTGAHAPFGQALLQGAQVAAYDINHEGGILGRQVNITALSDGADPLDAVPLTRRLLATNHPAMVIGFGGNDYTSAVPILNQSKMVTLADVGDPALDSQQLPYIYRAVPSDALTGTAMAYWAKQQGYHNVALVFDAAEGAQTLIPPIQAAASSFGLNILQTATTDLPAEAPSYRTAVAALVAAKPDALLLQLEPGGAGTFFQELNAQGGGNIPVIGSDSTATADWVKAMGVANAQRQLTSVVAATGLAGTQGAHFIAIFNQLFHTAPRALSGSNYDALMVGALAMDAAHSIDPTVYVKYIGAVTNPASGHTSVDNYQDGFKLLQQGKSIKYVGLSSPMVFSATHTITTPYEAIKTDANGGIQIVATISATNLEL